MNTRTYALVGSGGRAPMFLDPLAGEFSGTSRLLALCDLSLTRMEYHRRRLRDSFGYEVPAVYIAEDFPKLLEEMRPDVMIICTVDNAHSEYVVAALEAGCDVICEKPIATESEQCREILDACQRTGRKVTVTFNLRWVPALLRLREMIVAGAIGAPRQMVIEYLLNTHHGADYFRRWHSDKSVSGGLLVHKSTHHFDLANWLLDAIPESVHAMGSLQYYGRANAVARGEVTRSSFLRYAENPDPSDHFHLDLRSEPVLRGLYSDAEEETGYIRDLNVFRDGITIEDALSVNVRYRNGAMLSYTLNAFSPYEGYRIHIAGDAGRLEYEELLPDDPLISSGRGKRPAQGCRTLRHIPLFSEAVDIPLEVAEGTHGGGDRLLQQALFSSGQEPVTDPYGRSAGQEQGIVSALTGIAANRSIRDGNTVTLDKILPLRPEAVAFSDLL